MKPKTPKPIAELCEAHIISVLRHFLQKENYLSAEEIVKRSNTSLTYSTVTKVLNALEKTSMVERSYRITDIGASYFFHKTKNK